MPTRDAEAKGGASKPRGKAYGRWDFARDFSNGLFGLLNSGKVFPAFGLLILCIVGLVAYRLPEAELGVVARELLEVLRSSFGFAIAGLIATNLVWAWLLRRMHGIYQAEIDRLADLRAELMREKNSGREFIPIKEHRTSNGTHQEKYVLPEHSPTPKRKK